MDRRTAFRFLSGGFLLVILFSTMGCNRSPSARMEAVAVSPDGGLLAIDFGDDSTSFIYKIDVQSGNATRLTDAKVGRESSPAFSRLGSESHTPIRLAKGSRPASSSRTLMVPICTHGRLREGTITGLCSRSTVKQPFLPGLRTMETTRRLRSHIPMVGTCMQPIQTVQACGSSRMKGFIQRLLSPCRPTARAWCL